jgi:hypothetical protein
LVARFCLVLLDQIHHGQKHLPVPGRDARQFLLVLFPLPADSVVAFLHGRSLFWKVWQADSFRTGPNCRLTFNYN